MSTAYSLLKNYIYFFVFYYFVRVLYLKFLFYQMFDALQTIERERTEVG